MLDVDPQKRPSASQILQHSWMTSPNPKSTQLVVGTKVQDVKVDISFYVFKIEYYFIKDKVTKLK